MDSLTIRNYYVAYLDFLGTTDNILKDNAGKFLNDLNSICKTAIDSIKTINEFSNNDIFIKIFSDNILLACEVEQKINYIPKINILCSLCLHIQMEALKRELLIRGGIVKGLFFKNRNIVYGKALLDALELEKIAIYPRIITTLEVKKEAETHFIEDVDGFYHLNILSQFNLINNIRDKLLKILEKGESNKKYIQKAMWLIKKYNYYCELFHKEKQISNDEILNILNKRR